LKKFFSMPDSKKTSSLFKAIVIKAGLKQEVYAKTLVTFEKFKNEAEKLTYEYHKKIKQTKWPIPFEYKDHGQFEFELKFGGDVLIFFMHSNIFEFSRDHEVMKTSYIKEDKKRSYCGIIHIFNFLGDSFKYNRTNDLGYLIGRIFVNREKHYFIEGKREIGMLFNNFETSKLNESAIKSIIQSAILYTLNFDLLTPPYEKMKEVTVQEMQTTIDNMQIRTAKRLGYRFQADLSDNEQ
jgi:hypothetical protein